MANVGTSGGSIRVLGLRETIKQLEALGASKQEIVDANVRAANTLKNAAQPLVPERTGLLKSTLRVSKAKGYAQVMMGNAKVPYANPIHWGWFYDKEWFIQKNIKPNLFLYRALGTKLDTIIMEYNKDMQNLINKYGLGDNK
jgi:hypothetical protein